MMPIISLCGENTLAYDPKPIETSKVTLSQDLLALREKLAKNAHEVWASQNQHVYAIGK
jgi:hypothetical protein